MTYGCIYIIIYIYLFFFLYRHEKGFSSVWGLLRLAPINKRTEMHITNNISCLTLSRSATRHKYTQKIASRGNKAWLQLFSFIQDYGPDVNHVPGEKVKCLDTQWSKDNWTGQRLISLFVRSSIDCANGCKCHSSTFTVVSLCSLTLDTLELPRSHVVVALHFSLLHLPE